MAHMYTSLLGDPKLPSPVGTVERQSCSSGNRLKCKTFCPRRSSPVTMQIEMLGGSTATTTAYVCGLKSANTIANCRGWGYLFTSEEALLVFKWGSFCLMCLWVCACVCVCLSVTHTHTYPDLRSRVTSLLALCTTATATAPPRAAVSRTPPMKPPKAAPAPTLEQSLST